MLLLRGKWDEVYVHSGEVGKHVGRVGDVGVSSMGLCVCRRQGMQAGEVDLVQAKHSQTHVHRHVCMPFLCVYMHPLTYMQEWHFSEGPADTEASCVYSFPLRGAVAVAKPHVTVRALSGTRNCGAGKGK